MSSPGSFELLNQFLPWRPPRDFWRLLLIETTLRWQKCIQQLKKSRNDMYLCLTKSPKLGILILACGVLIDARGHFGWRGPYWRLGSDQDDTRQKEWYHWISFLEPFFVQRLEYNQMFLFGGRDVYGCWALMFQTLSLFSETSPQLQQKCIKTNWQFLTSIRLWIKQKISFHDFIVQGPIYSRSSYSCFLIYLIKQRNFVLTSSKNGNEGYVIQRLSILTT